MNNGWLPLRMARHLGAATARSGKAKRLLFWVRGYGLDFGHVYLGASRDRRGSRLLHAIPENSKGLRVIAIKPAPLGPDAKEKSSWGAFK